MPRSASHRLVLGTVSSIAMTAMLSACSQPASYATVDLGGSYGSTVAQAYSPVSGQPVYQSTSLYGPQSFPDAPVYQSTSQIAYADAPTNQVASLGGDGGVFDTYGITAAPETPQYSPQVYSSPSFEQAELLSSPKFQQEVQSVDRAFADATPLNAPAPFAEAPVEAIDPGESFVSDQAFDTAYAVPRFEPVAPAPFAAEPVPQSTAIEETALAPLSPPTPPVQPRVADDYATLDQPVRSGEMAPIDDGPNTQERRYEPWVAPQFGTEETVPETTLGQPAVPTQAAPVARRSIAQPPIASAPVARAPQTGPAEAYTREARDLLPPRPEQTRMPAPNAVPQLTVPGGARAPTASTKYPRPFEALRPGIWPELEDFSGGLVEGPSVTPVPTLASLETPVEQYSNGNTIERASERLGGMYTIKKGDSLLTIAQRIGMSPEILARDNGMTPQTKIYIGQKIAIPSQGPRADYENGIPMVDVAEVAATRGSSDIGAPVPTIDARTANALMAPERARQVSTPAKHVTTSVASARFAWPVHGNVYRLGAGQLEIDAEGNAPVAASASGRVVHVERGPMGVLVVIEHTNGWRSLTVGLENAQVAVGQNVQQGSTIGSASRDHRVRFELRDAGASIADALAMLRG